MTDNRPIVVGLPLDQQTDTIVASALMLGLAFGAPIVIVHALPAIVLENNAGRDARIDGARHSLAPRLRPLLQAGLSVKETIEVGPAAGMIIENAQRCGAQMIITGGGRPATVRRWLVGSVAEAVVRRAAMPVWVTRGRTAETNALLCPVDLSPPSIRSLEVAITLARLLGAPLRVLRVLPESEGDAELAESNARRSVQTELGRHDLSGVTAEVVIARGNAAERIVEAASQAGVLIIGSRGFDPFMPDWAGPVTTRALRHSVCSILTIREVHADLDVHLGAVTRLADAYQTAWTLIQDGRAEEALAWIEPAAEQAPFNATIQEAFGIALKQLGRDVEARARLEVARLLRDRIGPT